MFNWFKKKNKNKGFTSTKNLDSENPLLDFLQQETTRIMDEADEKKAPNKIVLKSPKNLKPSIKIPCIKITAAKVPKTLLRPPTKG